jgi:hypothetical protein
MLPAQRGLANKKIAKYSPTKVNSYFQSCYNLPVDKSLNGSKKKVCPSICQQGIAPKGHICFELNLN